MEPCGGHQKKKASILIKVTIFILDFRSIKIMSKFPLRNKHLLWMA